MILVHHFCRSRLINVGELRHSSRMYLVSLPSKCDILYLQEHWLSSEQLGLLSSISTKHLARGICGFTNVDILKGRSYGGCAVFWRPNLNAKVVDVDTGSNRICAVQFVTSKHKLLLINVYMPFEDSHIDTDEYSDNK